VAGTCIRDYIHVTDLVDAHVTVLAAALRNPPSLYNVGTGKGYSVRPLHSRPKAAASVRVAAALRNPPTPDLCGGDALLFPTRRCWKSEPRKVATRLRRRHHAAPSRSIHWHFTSPNRRGTGARVCGHVQGGDGQGHPRVRAAAAAARGLRGGESRTLLKSLLGFKDGWPKLLNPPPLPLARRLTERAHVLTHSAGYPALGNPRPWLERERERNCGSWWHGCPCWDARPLTHG
jgi:hypothetical protein